jgi:hypothetical protein
VTIKNDLVRYKTNGNHSSIDPTMAQKKTRCAGCRHYGHRRDVCRSRPFAVIDPPPPAEDVQPLPVMLMQLRVSIPRITHETEEPTPDDSTHNPDSNPGKVDECPSLGEPTRIISPPTLCHPRKAIKTRTTGNGRPAKKKSMGPLMKRAKQMSNIRWHQHQGATRRPKAAPAVKPTNQSTRKRPQTFEEALREADQGVSTSRVSPPARLKTIFLK